MVNKDFHLVFLNYFILYARIIFYTINLFTMKIFI